MIYIIYNDIVSYIMNGAWYGSLMVWHNLGTNDCGPHYYINDISIHFVLMYINYFRMSGTQYVCKPYKQGYTQEDINEALHAIWNHGWAAGWAAKVHGVLCNTLTDR